MKRVRLSINVDHVATLRNARGGSHPDPIHLSVLALNAGADGITVHLREDRRHIRERDVILLRQLVPVLNLECARVAEILDFALEIKPDLVTLVPEKRQELTTEGGLDVGSQPAAVSDAVHRLQDAGIPVSLFVDPDPSQIEAAAATGTRVVELHTGRYADGLDEASVAQELDALDRAAAFAAARGLRVHAGHGLRTDNVGPVAAIGPVEELSIGHYVMGRALQIGIEAAVREMREAIRG